MIVTDEAGGHGRSMLRDGLLVLGRQRVWAVIIFVIFVVGGFALASIAPVHYTAEAAIAIDVRKVQVILQDAVVSKLPSESPALRSEIDLITSRLIAERVIGHLRPEHAAALLNAPKSLPHILKQKAQDFLPFIRLVDNPTEEPANVSEEERRQQLVNHLLAGLRASNDGRSYTIFIAFRSGYPELSAEVANAVADVYLDHQVSVQVAATRGAGAWLGSKLNDLRDTLERSEIAVQEFRKKSGLIDQNGQSPSSIRATALNVELAAARAAVAGAEARSKTAYELAKGESTSGAMAEVLNSPVIQQLRREQLQLNRNLAELEDGGLSRSPQLQTLRAQISSIQKQLSTEVERILASLATEVQIAKQKEIELENAFVVIKEQVANSDQATIELRHLEREAAANREIYGSFLTRYKQAIEQEGLAAPEARVISRAQPASSPSSSQSSFIIIGILVGAGAAIGTALFRDRLDDRIWSSVQIENLTALPFVGSTPSIPFWNRLVGRSPTTDPGDGSRAALLKLDATLRLSRSNAGSQVLAITSASAGEGKTTLCASLARSVSAMGCKVIVVDTDLHRAGLSAFLSQPPTDFLDEVLRGERSAEEVIKSDSLGNFDFIAARPIAGPTELLLGSQQFSQLLATLREHYSVIIVDTPPICASADVVLVGSHADMCLFLVRWGWTRVDHVVNALRQLAQCNILVNGFVLTRVDFKRHRHYEVAWHRTIHNGLTRARGVLSPRRSRTGGERSLRHSPKEREVS